MEQETHEPLEYKNEAFKKKLEQFFTGFAHDEVGKQQFFWSKSRGLLPDVTKLSYLFYGTNEQHCKQRSLNKKIKNDAIYWANMISISLIFLNNRIFDKNLKLSPETLKQEIYDYPDLYQPVLCIAKTPAILNDMLMTQKRNLIRLKPGATEEVLITTGTIEEGESILLIKSSNELTRLIEFLISVSPNLEEDKDQFKFFLQQWQEYEKLIKTVQN